MYNDRQTDFKISSNESFIGQNIDIKPDTALSNISMPHCLAEEITGDNINNTIKNQVQEESNQVDPQLMTTNLEELNQVDPPSLIPPAPSFMDFSKTVLPILQGAWVRVLEVPAELVV